MFAKLLIANRGEIACRVIRTARRLGIATAAVYSEADRDALHVEMADEAFAIGAAPASASYLDIAAILRAADNAGADAIHPGYGFLSENAAFSRACAAAGIRFVGPPADAIEAMGDKSRAKALMERAGVPLVPGYHDTSQQVDSLQRAADEIGYPVVLKASSGGGGKGMRVVEKADDFADALAAAKRESIKSFGNDAMLIERYLDRPRHIEVQVFCDSHGNAVHLFERDCSIQRRHQKVIEEAPAPGIDDSLRQRMGSAALDAARAINYEGAGTVEFLLDRNGDFYFMEMNTRLQVEHPVTEMITGLDLVEWQLQVAAGEALPEQQADISCNGHAIEARIYAEDPRADFLPMTGRLEHLSMPLENSRIRIDSGVRQGDEISVHYDPMLAKLVVWDIDRPAALRQMANALAQLQIGGLPSNGDFLYNLVSCRPYKQAQLDTGFIERNLDELLHKPSLNPGELVPLAALYLILEQQQKARHIDGHTDDPWSPWGLANGWRMNEPHLHHYELLFGKQAHKVTIQQQGSGEQASFIVHSDNGCHHISGRLDRQRLISDLEGHRQEHTVTSYAGNYHLYTTEAAIEFRLAPLHVETETDPAYSKYVYAPMNGTLVNTLVNTGQRIDTDDPLLVMEAMKMEHTLRAPRQAIVGKIHYSTGDLVDGGAILLELLDHD